MVSSTFADFRQHREALIGAISGQGLHPIAMEQDSALPAGTVIDSSLQKVRDGSAYVGIIGVRYGNIPDSADHNPEDLLATGTGVPGGPPISAARYSCSSWVLIMTSNSAMWNWIRRRSRKLEAFREEAKRAAADSQVHRVYKVFNSLGEFEVAVTQLVAELRRYLDESAARSRAGPGPGPRPVPPAVAISRRRRRCTPSRAYIGSHEFVGRAAQLAAPRMTGPGRPRRIRCCCSRPSAGPARAC